MKIYKNKLSTLLVESASQDPQAVLKIVDKYLKSSLPQELSYKSSSVEQTDEGLRVALVLAHGKLDFKSMRNKKIEQGKTGAYSSAPSSKTQAVRQLTDHPKANINPDDQSTSLKMLQTMGYEALEKAKGKIESHLDCEFIANLHDVKRTGKGESHWEIYLVPNDEERGFKLKADHSVYTTNDRGQRIGLRQGNVGVVADETDFENGSYGTIKAIWPRVNRLASANGFAVNYHKCGDYVRFIHDAITVDDSETGEMIACIWFNDRANSYNATKLSYDVYVMSQEDIIKGMAGRGKLTDTPGSWWSNWNHRGTLVFSTQEIMDELVEALELYDSKR